MFIGRTIKIGGLKFKILPMDKGLYGNDAEWGACSLIDLKIWLNEACNYEQQLTTMIHETIEITNDMFDLGLTHVQISTLENTLYQVFMDNFYEGKGEE